MVSLERLDIMTEPLCLYSETLVKDAKVLEVC
jgi:hypothetical protein